MTTDVRDDAAPADPAALRERAAQVVAELADRLADPRRVAAAADFWHALGLSEGHPGAALLFAELAHHDPAHRATIHAHLAAAAGGLPGPDADGLFAGVPSLAFAAHTARQAPEDYAGLMRRLDPALDRSVRTRLDAERARQTEPQDGTAFHHDYDLIRGTTGLTRLLLARRAEHPELLHEALASLIRLLEPLPLRGGHVPGWWAPSGPQIDSEADFPGGRGHLNFGVAHGIPGTLAVLTAAYQEGVRVPGLHGAMTGIGDLLLTWRTADGGWPGSMTVQRFEDGAAPLRSRTAWCYGTPGVACVLHRAGEALDRADWREAAVAGLVRELEAPVRVHDSSLCHGWGGLLHLTGRLGRASGDPRLAVHRDRLAARVLDAYDPALPFGFRAGRREEPRESPGHYAGFLMGAAGIALALHSYAVDASPLSGWEMALALR
ncbi:lanthionine synthetase C family protein [Streptomyces pinistramenti]|uniref:lanthionine synthetase C family protein n=1 Tax=Streptomyces pinistramenti TaxID=2884812 RepID=UPI001D09327F|nr:lanthionine synthetase C family protein [Streptomyces pinistramenti]MCB5906071.1 lanthionine synthetase C family protein [Streptomyces pinistramenti]